MRITRIIALAIISGSFGLHASNAQTLRDAQPPSEFPPASYKGKQYVDSRGCIYIRAGIDGNVTWVPRVSRNRKQVCGFQPTQVAGATATPPAASSTSVEEITIPNAPATATASAPAAASTASPAPKAAPVTTTFKPVKPPKTTRDPVPTVAGTTTAPKTAAPKATAAKPAKTAVAPAAPAQSGCSNASALSQRYINNTPDVRCGPQSEAPVTYGRGGSGIGPQSSLQLTPNTRVVPAHVYENRQNTLATVEVPDGFRRVWEDGRLNPRRAERGLQPAVIRQTVNVPAGFRVVDRDDDRLNPMRGITTTAGDAQTALIWDNSVPRKLVPVDTSAARRVVLRGDQVESPAEADEPAFLFASRSAPDAPAPVEVTQKRYVRAATYSTEAEARSAAQSLARTGLPVRLGTVTRKGQSMRVVLAGPYTTKAEAREALVQVRAAGFSRARLN